MSTFDDPNDINMQLQMLNSDYIQYQSQSTSTASTRPIHSGSNINSQMPNIATHVNFQNINQQITTEQIKKPLKSDGGRNEFNDRLSNLSMTNFYTDKPPNYNVNMSPQFQQNSHYQSAANQNQQENPIYQYHNQNPMYLQEQSQQQPYQQTQPQSRSPMHQNPSEINNQSVNLRFQRFPVDEGQNSQTNQNMLRYNEFGYEKKDNLKVDYRQNMNNKIDNFIFDNVGNQYPPLITVNPNHMYGIDNRVNIQEKSRALYKQEANQRMSQYSPLSRASNVPIDMVNVPTESQQQYRQQYDNFLNNPNTKELLSSRMNQFSPLARTIGLNEIGNNSQGQTSSNDYKSQMFTANEKMKINTNFTDVNKGLKNVVNDQMPVFSNY